MKASGSRPPADHLLQRLLETLTTSAWMTNRAALFPFLQGVFGSPPPIYASPSLPLDSTHRDLVFQSLTYICAVLKTNAGCRGKECKLCLESYPLKKSHSCQEKSLLSQWNNAGFMKVETSTSRRHKPRVLANMILVSHSKENCSGMEMNLPSLLKEMQWTLSHLSIVTGFGDCKIRQRW